MQGGLFESTDSFNVKTSRCKAGLKTPIRSDGGIYQINILNDEIFVSGKNKIKGWINCGYAKKTDGKDIKEGDVLNFTWTDLPLSTSKEKTVSHECKVRIISNDEFKLEEIIKGKSLAFGGWRRITTTSGYDYLEEEKDEEK